MYLKKKKYNRNVASNKKSANSNSIELEGLCADSRMMLAQINSCECVVSLFTRTQT